MLHKDDSLGPSFKKLWSNEKLLDAVEQVVGPNVAGHPVWNLRIKLPRNAPEEVPWHQDNGYFEGNTATYFDNDYLENLIFSPFYLVHERYLQPCTEVI